MHQGLHLQFFPHQFTQVNHQINQMLIDDCLSYLKKLSGKRVFDLFCGIGNFSLPLARAGAQVTGLEVAADAVVQAEHNAARNRLANGVQFATADLYGTDADLPGPCDVLVLDPPRNGAGPNLASWVQKSGGTEMVYVSCNPASFAVDAALLARCGFRLQRVGIYDMFPHTAHVETMGYFVRQD
ncbi:MAG: methyltransferase [Pseudomonadota bacterium]